MSAEIERCPFCHYFAHVHTRMAKSTASGKHHFVRCPCCHTEGPRSLLSEDDAIAKWNIRASYRETDYSVDDISEFRAIGKAVNRAAIDLPDGARVQIDLERDAGSVCWLRKAKGTWENIDMPGEPFSVQIHAAIDAARVQGEKK